LKSSENDQPCHRRQNLDFLTAPVGKKKIFFCDVSYMVALLFKFRALRVFYRVFIKNSIISVPSKVIFYWHENNSKGITFHLAENNFNKYRKTRDNNNWRINETT